TGSDTDLRDLQQKETQVIKLPPVPENDPTFGYKKLNVVNGMPRKSTIEMKKPLPNPVPMEDDNASAEKGIWSRLWGWG
ncbi:2438_t:CDS:2, partial [Paraglomus occultum]